MVTANLAHDKSAPVRGKSKCLNLRKKDGVPVVVVDAMRDASCALAAVTAQPPLSSRAISRLLIF
jgi:hypothetical protein